MTHTGAALAPEVKQLTVTPLCTLEEAHRRFDNHFLDSSHVKVRLTESTHVIANDGATRLLFLKNVLDPTMVDNWWWVLQQINFHPAAQSRRAELRYSAGGYVQMGWMEFPQRGRGVVPTLTADSVNQWDQFRMLWSLLWVEQFLFCKYLPTLAQMQSDAADDAEESKVDYLFRIFDMDGAKYDPNRAAMVKMYEELQRDEPEKFRNVYLYHLKTFANDHFERCVQAAKDACLAGKAVTPLVADIKNPRAMRGYTIPGSIFSSITINQTAVFRSHEDGNNLDGAFSCLAAFGKYSGGDLCFPRLGVSCPVAPGDLLIGDTNREQHGNIGPLMGHRISVVTYMRDKLGPLGAE